MGDACCDRELYKVYCEGDAVNCCTGIAKSVAIAVWGGGGGWLRERRQEEDRTIRLENIHIQAGETEFARELRVAQSISARGGGRAARRICLPLSLSGSRSEA